MSDRKASSKQIVSGFLWKFGERIVAQGISFLISLVLARILLPEQYGSIALVLVFINIANVLVSDGLGASLIQDKNSNDVDFSSMFFCSFVFAGILYFVLFICAPFIAEFYNNMELIPVIRVLSLQIPLSAVKSIQHAFVSKHMLFRKFFWSTLGGTIVSGVIGIIMAYNGFGVWALVEQYLVNSIVDMSVLFFTVKWRPKMCFSFTSVRNHLSYSWKLLAASLINTVYSEIRSLIMGRIYTEADLAYNTKGNQFPTLFINNIDTSISSVLFPAMSKVNDDPKALKQLTRKSMKITSFIIFPLMVGMISVADSMVRVLLTDRWIGCVPFLQIACVCWMFQPCLTANNQALKASGRSDLCLKLEIYKKIIGFALVAATMNISVFALAFSNAIFALISCIINVFPVRKVINYGYMEQLLDMLPALVLSIIMGIVVKIIGMIKLGTIPLLVLQIVIGAAIYISLSYITRNESFLTLLSFARSLMRRKNS